MEDQRRKPMSLWRTAMLVRAAASGGGNTVTPMVALLGGIGLVLGFALTLFPPNELTDGKQLPYAGLLMLLACIGTAFFAARRARALAFMRVLPAVHTARSLILLPVFVVGVTLTVFASVFVPLLSALTLLGWWCWAASVGLRFAFGRGRLLLLVGTPLVYVGALVAAGIASPFAGAWALALSSLFLGLTGYLTARPALSRDLLSHAPGPLSPPAAASFVNTQVRRGVKQGGSWTMLRVVGLAAQSGSPVVPLRRPAAWMSIALAILAASAWIGPLDNPMLAWTAVVMASNLLAESNGRAKVEFLSTRPLPLSRLRGAMVVSLALIAVLVPTVALVRAAVVTTIPRGDLRKLPYPTTVIAAAAFPAASDPGGASASPAADDPPAFRGNSPVPVTPALRTLMLQYLAGLVLLQCASFGTLSAFTIARARKPGRWRYWAYFAASFSVPMVILLNTLKQLDGSLVASNGGFFPPLSVAVLLAALSLWPLRRSLALPLRA